MSYFQLFSWCLNMWSNTIFHVWRITSPGLYNNFLAVSIYKLKLNRLNASWIHSYFDNVMTAKLMINNRTAWKADVNLLKCAIQLFEVTKLKVNSLNTSSSTVTKQFIYIIIWSKSAPRPSGLDSCTAVVSSAAIDEREHTAVVASSSFTTGTWGESRSCYSRTQTVFYTWPCEVWVQDKFFVWSMKHTWVWTLTLAGIFGSEMHCQSE